MKYIIIILTLLLAFLWGYIQPNIFPPETYGILFLLTSFVGGFLIGMIGISIYYRYD